MTALLLCTIETNYDTETVYVDNITLLGIKDFISYIFYIIPFGFWLLAFGIAKKLPQSPTSLTHQ